MLSYKEALNKANKLTRIKGKETSATKLLLLHFSCLEPTELFVKYEEEMPLEMYNNFFKGLTQYLEENIPVQQIMGYVYFYGYKFIVSDKVLIPRFETEELVVNVLMLYDEHFKNQKIDLVDIGTGSGCLAVTLKKEEETNFNVYATDISNDALEVAKQNAINLEADVDFLQGDMLQPVLNKKFDMLVSNPPYIPQNEKVDEIIYDNEPHVALFGGSDGLKFYRKILKDANKILKPKSIIAFEHGYDKAEKLRKIAKEYFPNSLVYTLKDMQKLDRMTFILNGIKE
ncbi:peptide chain release factor N(5)-glutamine methyltransferase [Candidatus Izemoplasma sp. B36]|uniref:peptide chain release factor N(5)-glutamine methyltransferase n=1 Tax=Candidatus Izemoplasma sp. B36 TaxID=3242468 RepID=UPI003555E0EA